MKEEKKEEKKETVKEKPVAQPPKLNNKPKGKDVDLEGTRYDINGRYITVYVPEGFENYSKKIFFFLTPPP